MKITQLQCDINKKKYNLIDIVNNYCSYLNIYCMNLIHDLVYLFSKTLSF